MSFAAAVGPGTRRPSMETLRIFISSPGMSPRNARRRSKVLASLKRQLEDEVLLLPVLWEDLPLGRADANSELLSGWMKLYESFAPARGGV